ncbi:MAG: nucleotidyltransferase domain-containing protein [Chitinivibrionales bacterium]|nr:nucleotidyltransferase domain-containing protein [Chitinivibrionales bacterium]
MAASNGRELALQKAQAFLRLLREQNIAFENAFIFGSYAKGTAREDSDIDIAVISEHWLPDIIDARLKLMKLACTIDSRIEPHPIEKSNFPSENPFLKEIMATGTLL